MSAKTTRSVADLASVSVSTDSVEVVLIEKCETSTIKLFATRVKKSFLIDLVLICVTQLSHSLERS
jgi:hypothetical protein